MRPLEIILLLLATILPFILSVNLFQKNKKVLLNAILGVIIIHFIFEGYRWQMIPAYIMISLLMLFIWNELRFFKPGVIKTVVMLFVSIILLIPGWALPIILPVFTLPTPSGEYSVGSQYLAVKTDQDEIITEDPDDKRQFMVKVWYPAGIENEQKEHYLDEGNRLGFSRKYGLPDFTMNYLDYVDTHTYENPEVAQGDFPVLIFSHGYHSDAYGYYTLLEEIASHGFIIFNINHTFESGGSLFPDGEIKLYDYDFSQKTNNQEMADMAWKATQDYQKATNEEERFKVADAIIRDYIAADITERWSIDISTVIDQLETWKTASFLKNHIDISQIGVFGHSQGGAATAQALLDDKRIKAGINLDGAQWGTLIDTTISQPFSYISLVWPEDHIDLNKYAYRNLSKSKFSDLTIKNTGHSNFMDIPLFVNLSYVNEAGTIDPNYGHEIINNLVLAFFNDHLKKQNTNIVETAKKYDEVVIK